MSGVRRISSGGPWEDLVGYSRAVAVGPWVLVSGCTAVRDGSVRCEGDALGQARVALDVARRAVEEAGASFDDVVRTRMYVTDMAHADAVGQAHREAFGDVRPAASMVGVRSLIHPELLVEIEVDAYREPA